MQPNLKCIVDIPGDILRLMVSYLDIYDMSHLAKTCKYINTCICDHCHTWLTLINKHLSSDISDVKTCPGRHLYYIYCKAKYQVNNIGKVTDFYLKQIHPGNADEPTCQQNYRRCIYQILTYIIDQGHDIALDRCIYDYNLAYFYHDMYRKAGYAHKLNIIKMLDQHPYVNDDIKNNNESLAIAIMNGYMDIIEYWTNKPNKNYKMLEYLFNYCINNNDDVILSKLDLRYLDNQTLSSTVATLIFQNNQVMLGAMLRLLPIAMDPYLRYLLTEQCSESRLDNECIVMLKQFLFGV